VVVTAGHQQLPGRNLHDPRQHLFAAVRVNPWEPRLVRAVTEHDEMSMRLDQARHHRPAACVEDHGPRGHGDFGGRSGGDDLVAFDEDRRLVDGGNVETAEEHPAHERQAPGRLCSRYGHSEERHAQRDDEREQPGVVIQPHVSSAFRVPTAGPGRRPDSSE
jgi:hypothetical protein